jgi:hypothetical protein
VLLEQLLEGVEADLGVGQLGDGHRPADVVDDRDRQGVLVGVDAGEHADSFLLSPGSRSADAQGAAHALAGCRRRRSYQASAPEASATSPAGTHRTRPLKCGGQQEVEPRR